MSSQNLTPLEELDVFITRRIVEHVSNEAQYLHHAHRVGVLIKGLREARDAFRQQRAKFEGNMLRVACSNCQGTGKFLAGDCPVCNGTKVTTESIG